MYTNQQTAPRLALPPMSAVLAHSSQLPRLDSDLEESKCEPAFVNIVRTCPYSINGTVMPWPLFSKQVNLDELSNLSQELQQVQCVPPPNRQA